MVRLALGASPPHGVIDALDALGRLDTHLYLWLTGSRNPILSNLAVASSALNAYGLVWIAAALLVARGLATSPRRAAIATVLVGMIVPWLAAEALKRVFMRIRPFDALPGPPELLIGPPVSPSMPSGDAALAFGAAAALGFMAPRWRWPALAFACLVAVGRVIVGVHYPSDALLGAFIGVSFGALGPAIVAAIARRGRSPA